MLNGVEEWPNLTSRRSGGVGGLCSNVGLPSRGLCDERDDVVQIFSAGGGSGLLGIMEVMRR